MADSLKVDPEQLKAAAGELRSAVDSLQGPLAVDEQLEAARAAHGPIFAELKQALATLLPARRQELLDQIDFGTRKADDIEKWANTFATGEEAHRLRQGEIGL